MTPQDLKKRLDEAELLLRLAEYTIKVLKDGYDPEGLGPETDTILKEVDEVLEEIRKYKESK